MSAIYYPPVNSFQFVGGTVTDGTRPVGTYGVTSTPAQDAYGSYANLGVISSAHDTYEWDLVATNVQVATASKCTMIAIGVDPAGGASFTTKISEFVVGVPPLGVNGAFNVFRLRLFVPAGASVGIKSAIHHATLTPGRYWISQAKGSPTHPWTLRRGVYSDSFGGSVANCQGVTVTPGTTSDGAWAEIGVLTRTLWWWEYGLTLDDATASVAEYHVDIAIGDATYKRTIVRNHMVFWSGNESTLRSGPAGTEHVGVAGEKIYARVQSNAALDDGVYSIGVIGIGG